MNKKLVVHLLRKYGDAMVSLVTGDHILVTIDFSNKYIRRVRRAERFPSLKGKILWFDWTNYKFDAVDVKDIVEIKPLSDILKNKGVETHG